MLLFFKKLILMLSNVRPDMYHTYHMRPDEVVIISATRKGKKISLPVSPLQERCNF